VNDTAPNLEVAIEGLLRRIIREEIGTLKTELNGQDDLLGAEEAANLLSVSEDWL
jgi:hypothetical protein